ncbi:MAG: hypothetical protein SGCHY_002775 [Lobulomycetales sp.]
MPEKTSTPVKDRKRKQRAPEDDDDHEAAADDHMVDWQNGGGLYDESDSDQDPEADPEADPELQDPQAEDDQVQLLQEEEDVKVYIPNASAPLARDETLVHDDSAYLMLHSLNVEWPCLSFDFCNGPACPADYPVTAYMVAGSQAAPGAQNKLYAMKVSGLDKNCVDEDDDDAMDDDDDNDVQQRLDHVTVPVSACVNRVRVMPHPESSIVACWTEDGTVSVRDFSAVMRSLDSGAVDGSSIDLETRYARKSSNGVEGYALDWSAVKAGRLATGDNDGVFSLLELAEAGSWSLMATPHTGHQGSIEDLQWSPSEADVLASAGSDGYVRIWDTRSNRVAIEVKCHDTDVNVISWNRSVDHLLVSGSDSGAFSIWDLRNFAASTPAASFSWHKQPITSVEWHPWESSMLSVSGADEQLTLWDLALEADFEQEVKVGGEEVQVPPQLLFIHQGQQSIKEQHWHPRCHVHLQDEADHAGASDDDAMDDVELPFEFERHNSPDAMEDNVVMMDWVHQSPVASDAAACDSYSFSSHPGAAPSAFDTSIIRKTTTPPPRTASRLQQKYKNQHKRTNSLPVGLRGAQHYPGDNSAQIQHSLRHHQRSNSIHHPHPVVARASTNSDLTSDAYSIPYLFDTPTPVSMISMDHRTDQSQREVDMSNASYHQQPSVNLHHTHHNGGSLVDLAVAASISSSSSSQGPSPPIPQSPAKGTNSMLNPSFAAPPATDNSESISSRGSPVTATPSPPATTVQTRFSKMAETASEASVSSANVDADERPYKCSVSGCNKSYKNPGGLKYHATHGHKYDTGDPILNNIINKPYQCTISDCPKRYKNVRPPLSVFIIFLASFSLMALSIIFRTPMDRMLFEGSPFFVERDQLSGAAQTVDETS